MDAARTPPGRTPARFHRSSFMPRRWRHAGWSRPNSPPMGQIWPLRARIDASTLDGELWLIDFPVSQLNSRTVRGAAEFQVETGPVLIPERLAGSQALAGGFALAFVILQSCRSRRPLRSPAAGLSGRATDDWPHRRGGYHAFRRRLGPGPVRKRVGRRTSGSLKLSLAGLLFACNMPTRSPPHKRSRSADG